MNTSARSLRRFLAVAASAFAGLTLAGAPPLAAQAAAGTGDSTVYFVSPSGLWHCAITPDGPQTSAGCRGPVPAGAPHVSGGGVADIAPNAVTVTGDGPARFVFVSDASLDAPDAQVLPYGTIISAGAFNCAIDETEGVTCGVREHFFTVSDSAYRLG